MKTYIRKSIKGYYIEFPEEIDATYWSGKIGTTYEDFENNKWILLSNELVAFHNDYPDASIKLVMEMYIPEPVIVERTLAEAKEEKIEQIKDYDSSTSVNSFNVVSGGVTVSAWLTPAERANYRSSIDAAELVGIDNLSLYIGEIPITLPTATAKLMLALIQLYADLCFIITKQHIAAVEALDSIESVDNYDITQDYPNNLEFSI